MKRNFNKVLLSVAAASLLCSSALGVDYSVNIQSGDFDKYFTFDDKQNAIVPTDTFDTKQDAKFTFTSTSEFDTGDSEKINVVMDSSKKLEFVNNATEQFYISNLNATAAEVKGTDINFQFIQPSVINGNLVLTSAQASAPTTDNVKGSTLLLANGQIGGINGTGSLKVNGDFSADKSLLMFYGGFVEVGGKAEVTNSNISLVKTSFSELAANNVSVIQAGSFNTDIEKLNKGIATLGKFTNDFLSASEIREIKTLLKNDEEAYAELMSGYTADVSEMIDYKLSVVDEGGKKVLKITGVANDNAIDLTKQTQKNIEILERIIDSTDGQDEASVKLREMLEAKQKSYQDLIKNGKVDDKELISTIAKELPKADQEALYGLRSVLSKLNDKGFAADLASADLTSAIKVVNESKAEAAAIAGSNGTTTGVNSAINTANDVSLGNRIAMLNNPFGTYASKFSGLKLAAGAGDMNNYVNDYTGSVWANVFGGSNIIDGHSGGLYGATVGVDKWANENFLLGMYFSYADAKVNDGVIEQKSDNMQIGVYANAKLGDNYELGLKASVQASPTKTTSINGNGDYTNTYFGASANVGRVFEFDTLHIKPFAGLNYYHSETPDYTIEGRLPLQIAGMSNNSLSIDLGAEFRKYFSEGSYLFITPKIEQFVINSGSDYSANLFGTPFLSVASDNKKKTYAQVVFGGNLDVNEQLSFNAGLGAKQILAGKVNNNNETYLSGQLGVKYKF